MTIAQRVVGPVIPSDTNTVDLTMTGQTLTADVKPGSIDTTEMADDAVTPAKLDSTVFAGSGTAGTAAHSDHTHTSSAITNFQTSVSANTDVAANTAARHTHSNKTTLDATTASFTTAKDSKLTGIASGAEVNVQSDWTASSGDAFIKNKPSVMVLGNIDGPHLNIGSDSTGFSASSKTIYNDTLTSVGSGTWHGLFILNADLSRDVSTGGVFLSCTVTGMGEISKTVSYAGGILPLTLIGGTQIPLSIGLTGPQVITIKVDYRGDTTAGTTSIANCRVQALWWRAS